MWEFIKNNTNRNILFIFLLCILFLITQYAAQFHSVEHLFHDHEEACAVYHAIEDHKTGIIENTIVVTFNTVTSLSQCLNYLNPCHSLAGYNFARAPPANYPA